MKQLVGLRLGLGLGLALGLASCGHAEARRIERASRQLGYAVSRGDEGRIRGAVVPGARASVDTQSLAKGKSQRAWSKALRDPDDVRLEAATPLGAASDLSIVWTPKGWRLDEDPTDVYAQGTARQALRALVLASRMQRWDVLVRLAPKRYRMGLSQSDLRRAWTEGTYAEMLNQARDRVAEHLHDSIVSDAHEATLRIAKDHVVRLEREGDLWVVVDFLPERGPS